MSRDIKKTIEEYNQLCEERDEDFGVFYLSDLQQLRNIAVEKGGIHFWDIVYYAIDASLSAGFIMGYRAAQSEIKKE